MSDNWIVQNLNSALSTWSEKMAELWTLLTENPATFKGGGIWRIMTNINDALTAIAYGLLVLFFAAGIIKTCGSFTDLKKPEHVLKAIYPVCTCSGSNHVWNGTYAGTVFHCARNRDNRNEWLQYGRKRDGTANGDCR